MPEESESKALIIGISGVSSSGKTTLARILRDIFPRSFILHEDDFYKTDAEIPVNEVSATPLSAKTFSAVHQTSTLFISTTEFQPHHHSPPTTTIANAPQKGIQDWDCIESINLQALSSTLQYIRHHGQIPPDFVSKEDKNSVGNVDIDKSVIKDLEWNAGKW